MLRELEPVVPIATGEPREPRATADAPPSQELLLAVLEHAEHGVVVADGAGRAVYMNASARAMVGSPTGIMPAWLAVVLPGLRRQLVRQSLATERVVHEELALRLQARPLPRAAVLMIEVGVAAGSGGHEVAGRLTRALGLATGDAELLALLWRGLSNDEIAHALAVRTGTIKSRLFRLYQRLGVKKRSAAVLRAQEALAS